MKIQKLKSSILINERQRSFYKKRLARFLEKDIFEIGIHMGLSSADALILAEIFSIKAFIQPFMDIDNSGELLFSKN